MPEEVRSGQLDRILAECQWQRILLRILGSADKPKTEQIRLRCPRPGQWATNRTQQAASSATPSAATPTALQKSVPEIFGNGCFKKHRSGINIAISFSQEAFGPDLEELRKKDIFAPRYLEKLAEPLLVCELVMKCIATATGAGAAPGRLGVVEAPDDGRSRRGST
ncbi:hypothetical protein B0H10DRAFT_1938552 [Mycena sp. CBHHK59/15]|nr:hypothetical protein B0H10DRAFT_1938552 [Mycena sp. CBHHK59/15]